MLDNVMIETAKQRLAGRRLLDVEGPLGLGTKGIPLQDTTTEDGTVSSQFLPLHMIREVFTLGIRDLAHYEQAALPFNAQAVAEAALEVARQEDTLIFYGAPGVDGLMTAEGANRVGLSDWGEVGTAMDDLINAVNTLDTAGFYGPYTLALAPARYNLLFRRYQNGNMSEIEHVRTLVTDGIVKAPILEEGGVLVAAARPYASIVLGQDMTIGFIGPAEDQMEFFISESLALRLLRPQAVCVLEGDVV
jgi:uncharacterized linocin/CFP29 family protein